MLRLLSAVALLASCFVALPARAAGTQPATAGGFQPIFNGRDLAGWAGAVDSVEVRDGAIVWRPKKGGTLYWDRELGDFQVRFRFKLVSAANNGLAIRYPGSGDTAYVGLCELQILAEDYEQVKKTRLDPRQLHGSAYGMVAAKQGFQKPIGEWNEQEVTVRGSTIKVVLNGTTILDADLAQVDLATVHNNKPHPGLTRPRGFFGFAGHNDPVEFKDIVLKEL